MERRTLLKGVGALIATSGLAGCFSGETSSSDRTKRKAGDGSSGGSGSTTTEAGTPDKKIRIDSQEFYTGDFGEFGVRGEGTNVSGSTIESVTIDTYYLDSEGTRIGEGIWTGSDYKDGTSFKFDSTSISSVEAEKVEDYELKVSVSDY